MNVKNTVPLCLLAGMVALTSGCTAMKLSSEDPTTRMEAVREFTAPIDLVCIACMTYPDDVRLEAFNKLVANKDQVNIDLVAKTLYTGSSFYSGRVKNPLLESDEFYDEFYGSGYPLRVQYKNNINRTSIENTHEEMRTAIAKNISEGALCELLSGFNPDKIVDNEILKELLNGSPYTVPALASMARLARQAHESNPRIPRMVDLLSSEPFKAAPKDPNILTSFSLVGQSEILFKWYKETTDKEVLKSLFDCGSDEYVDKILTQNPDKFLDLCEIVVTNRLVSEEKRKELGNILTQKYPENELAMDYLFAGLLDEEGRGRVLTEANAQKIFERLQKRAAEFKCNPFNASAPKEQDQVNRFAALDFLNACPEFAQKVDPKAAVSLLKKEVMYRGDVESFSKLSPRIALALVEEGSGWASNWFWAPDPKIYDTLLKRLSIPDAYAMLKKKVDSGKIKPSVFRQEMQKVISSCEQNDATVEALLKTDFAPSAIGYRPLQAALKVDTVSEASKAKIQAYMEKARAEALANEAKAKEERLVIDHCYVPMREIDHWALPPQKGVSYSEEIGTIRSFGWTAQQCYDWFELENDNFQWRFAQKFGLADFKFDMDVRVEEAQTSFSPGLAMLDIMGGDGTPVMPEPAEISVNHWWLSTTRARGKNVEFLYNDEDKNNTLIMREIQ